MNAPQCYVIRTLLVITHCTVMILILIFKVILILTFKLILILIFKLILILIFKLILILTFKLILISSLLILYHLVFIIHTYIFLWDFPTNLCIILCHLHSGYIRRSHVIEVYVYLVSTLALDGGWAVNFTLWSLYAAKNLGTQWTRG